MEYEVKRKQKVLEKLISQPIVAGKGLINKAIDALPFPLHVPGMNYLGPGTPLELNVEKNVRPANKLDEAAMRHDIAYSKSKNLEDRHAADEVLQHEAWDRFKSGDAGLIERAYSLATAGTMKAKRALGAGVVKPTVYERISVSLDECDVKRLTRAIERQIPVTITIRHKRTKKSIMEETALPLTANQITRITKARNNNKNIQIKLSVKQLKYLIQNNDDEKIGGFLPAALLAALPAITAVGSLVTSGINAWNNKKANDKLVEERIRHNKAMETLSTNTEGKGIYLYKKPVSGEGIRKKAEKESNEIQGGSEGNILMAALLKKKLLR